ncbi:hypothetical protein VRB44_14215 [Pseudomonas trivialis]|uniref:hypothetical protein n=1 Tax=Pseudomonas trivialis TaxID=200450 RepID=UPI0030D36FDE
MLFSLLDKFFNRPLTDEAFAKKFMDSTRKAGFSENLNFEKNEFRIRHGDGSYFNLHNAFRDYQNADKAQKSAVLTGYVSTLLEAGRKTETVFDNVKALLRPVIRNLAMLEEIRLEHARKNGDKQYDYVSQPLVETALFCLLSIRPSPLPPLPMAPKHIGV